MKNIEHVINELNALKFDDIPWDRLFTANGSGKLLKDNLQAFLNADDSNCTVEQLQRYLGNITREIEQQSSFFLATPFAFVVMAHRFDAFVKKYGYEDANRRLEMSAKGQAQSIEDLMNYLLISCLKYNLSIQADGAQEHYVPIYPHVQGLLKEEFLYDYEVDEETGEEVEVEPAFDDDWMDESFYRSVDFYTYAAFYILKHHFETFLKRDDLCETAIKFCTEYTQLLESNAKKFID